MKGILIGVLLTTFAASLLAADENQQENQRLTSAADVLQQIQSNPDRGIPPDLLHRAYCVVVIPNMKKAGFIFSGKYGRGYASCRTDGHWSAPAAMRIEGGGFGLQAGASDTDVIMLVMTRKGMDSILSSKFTLGAQASVAAGPVGTAATAQTDANLNVDILTYSRTRGAFAGISLQGATLRPDEDADKALYGHQVNSRNVLTGNVQNPVRPDPFTRELTRYGGTARA
ncbi:MAG TPA: lipid-binding SYLF domain-containing protein [Bryobacteraceae bacterium]|nr:lipid-binding SYLF domain-containing protein [Bryobacteraceae bacterium]